MRLLTGVVTTANIEVRAEDGTSRVPVFDNAELLGEPVDEIPDGIVLRVIEEKAASYLVETFDGEAFISREHTQPTN